MAKPRVELDGLAWKFTTQSYFSRRSLSAKRAIAFSAMLDFDFVQIR